MNRYLEYIDLLYDSKDPAAWDDILRATCVEEIPSLTSTKGLSLVSCGEDDDSIDFLFENDKLKLTAYQSSRGYLYQRGAFDGERKYAKSNLGKNGHPPESAGWVEVMHYICANIAEDFWKEYKKVHAS